MPDEARILESRSKGRGEMRLRYTAAPWAAPELTPEAAELADILADDVWSESSVEFYAERDAKIRLGKRAPGGCRRPSTSSSR